MPLIVRHFTTGNVSTVPLGNRIICIGSSRDSDIRISSGCDGDLTAKIEPANGAYFLEAHQRGKVLLNGEKIKRTQLNPGDRIEIGADVLILDSTEKPIMPDSGPVETPFSALITFTELVGKERNLEQLLGRLMEHLLSLLSGSEAFIFKLDTDGDPQVFVTTEKVNAEERFSDTVVQKVVKDKKGLFIANALSDPSFSDSKSIANLKLSSIVCAPILIAGSLLGIVYIGSRKPDISYGDKDLVVLSVYASLAGMLINHVDYIGQQNRAISKLTGHVAEEGFVAESRAMQDVIATVKIVAASDITVLLEGPTGCGKNHVAELIHKKSARAGKPFLVVNCSSLRGELLESELFGHKKGSFTGATEGNQGLFAAAKGGTLVLDEIGELDGPIQAKLLRVLETGTIRPLGTAHEIPVNVRVICATNRDLLAMAGQGSFRSDLYYRINQFAIKIPPLAERADDVELLAYFFLEKYKASYPAKEILDFHPETLAYIRRHDWPGNIRELSNTIHRAVLSSDGPFLAIPHSTGESKNLASDFEGATRAFQKELIDKAIKRTGGNKEEAAKLLGLSRSTFFRYQASLGG